MFLPITAGVAVVAKNATTALRKTADSLLKSLFFPFWHSYSPGFVIYVCVAKGGTTHEHY